MTAWAKVPSRQMAFVVEGFFSYRPFHPLYLDRAERPRAHVSLDCWEYDLLYDRFHQSARLRSVHEILGLRSLLFCNQ